MERLSAAVFFGQVDLANLVDDRASERELRRRDETLERSSFTRGEPFEADADLAAHLITIGVAGAVRCQLAPRQTRAFRRGRVRPL